MTDLFGTIDRLREPERPRFVRFTDSGKVHVLEGYEPFGSRAGIDDGSLVGAILASEKALCGVRGPAGALSGVSTFPDDDLCRGCYKRWPFDTAHLFEHPMSHEGVH